MSGSMHRWTSQDSIPAADSVSQYSATYSDISANDSIRSPDIAQRLYTLFKEQLYTDVKFTLSCGVKPKPTIVAHKAILAIGSEKFREILYDSKVPNGEVEIQINNIPFNAFKNVVEYLYTDDVIFDSDQSVLETLAAATKFEVQALVNRCESYIEGVELTEDNVCGKLQMANNYKLESLKGRCFEFIQENTSAVLRSPEFLATNSSVVKSICLLDHLNIRSEMELLNGVVRWVESNLDSSRNNKRGMLEPFLKHIRLLNVSLEDFNQFVQKHKNLFSAAEAASILCTLANPSNPAPNLPTWCCKNRKNRCSYHLLAAPQTRERGQGNSNMLRTLSISLRPTKYPNFLPNLLCAMDLKCIRGRHQVEGLKLSFNEPVNESSIIGHLTIQVRASPSNFYFEENLKIENSKNVEVRFSRRLFTKYGDSVHIKAEAKHVKNYNFLQFDDRWLSNAAGSPFACEFGSVPKENRLFFITEVLYRNMPSGRRKGPPRVMNIRN